MAITLIMSRTVQALTPICRRSSRARSNSLFYWSGPTPLRTSEMSTGQAPIGGNSDLSQRQERIRSLLTMAFQGEKMVGTAGFEPTTTTPPVWCATRLRYAPLARILSITDGESYASKPFGILKYPSLQAVQSCQPASRLKK